MPSNKQDPRDEDSNEMLKPAYKNGFDDELNKQDFESDPDAGTNPDTPLTSHDSMRNEDDPWKNSLANDELRAPDS